MLCPQKLEMQGRSLDQELANFFSKGPDSKYFRLFTFCLFVCFNNVKTIFSLQATQKQAAGCI